MRCAVSFLTVIVLSVAVALMALYIIWITENEGLHNKYRFLLSIQFYISIALNKNQQNR